MTDPSTSVRSNHSSTIIATNSTLFRQSSPVPPWTTPFGRMAATNSPSLTTTAASTSGGLGAGPIAGIVIACLLLVGALIGLGVWLGLKWKRKRKLEGKYCPAAEEQKSNVKDLPPLPNPMPERLI